MRRDGLQTPFEKLTKIDLDDKEDYPDIKLKKFFKRFFKKSLKIANLIASGTEDYMYAKEVISRGNMGASSSYQSLISADLSSKRRRLDQI